MAGRGSGHIRERSAGSFELRYFLGIDPGSGKRRYATATVRGSRKDAEKELRRLLGTVDTGEHVDPNRITVRAWLQTWVAAIREEVAPTTHERYAALAAHYIAPALGNLRLTKLAPLHIQEFYSRLASGGRRDGKRGALSPKTRGHIHRVLHVSLSRAVEQRLIARNPADAFRRRLPKVERREMTTLSPEQSTRLLAAVRHEHIYGPVLIALATGARRGEVLALRWRNVDLDRGLVRVVESLEQTRAGLRFKPPKTDRTRVITLPAFAVSELRRLKREQAETLLKLGVRQTGAALVCARPDGEPVVPMSLTEIFHRRVVLLGSDFPQVRFHDLRHSHATQLLLAGVHAKIVQERLGHASITTTLDVYSHVTATMQEDAAARIDAAFSGALNISMKVVE